MVAARGSSASDAFAELCRRYWMPIYASVRRQGRSADEAEDLAQGFFLHLIERCTVAHADRERGRFRGFMLGALRRFLASDHEHERVAKRGGDQRFVPLDAAMMESLLATDDDETLSLDLQFDRQWARALIDNALNALRDQYVRDGDLDLFEVLRPFLDPGSSTPSYEQLAKSLDRNVGALKTTVHRLRQRFRDLLRREVAYTVATADEVDAELTHLRSVLSAEMPTS